MHGAAVGCAEAAKGSYSAHWGCMGQPRDKRRSVQGVAEERESVHGQAAWCTEGTGIVHGAAFRCKKSAGAALGHRAGAWVS